MKLRVLEMLKSALAVALSLTLAFAPLVPAAEVEHLAPPSALKDERTLREIEAAERILETMREMEGSGHQEGKRFSGVDGSLTHPVATERLFSTALPIYRALAQPPPGYSLEEERILAQGYFERDGSFVAEKEAETFWQDSHKRLVQRVMSIFRQFHGEYEVLTPRIRILVVENGFSLIRIRQNLQEDYEILMDRATFELATRVNIVPLLTLQFNHELNHALLRERFSGRERNILIEEAAVNAVDLVTFQKFREGHRRDVYEALVVLEEMGFATKPYRRFLSRGHPRKFRTRGLPSMLARSFAIATDPAANPQYHQYMQRLQGLLKIDYLKVLRRRRYKGLARTLLQAEAHGDLLYAMVDVFETALARPLKDIERYTEGLFERFDPQEYLNNGVPVARVEKEIMRHDLPALARVGGEKELRRLEDMVGSKVYSTTLRIAIAETIMKLAGPILPASVRNPFFIRDLIAHSHHQRLRSPRARSLAPQLGPVQFDNIAIVLRLLGNANVESPRMYRDLRAELVGWILEAQGIIQQLYAEHGKKADEHPVYRRASQLRIMAMEMFELSRKNLGVLLTLVPLNENWATKVRFETPPETLFAPTPGMRNREIEALEEKRYYARIDVEDQDGRLRDLLMAPGPIREDLFSIYGTSRSLWDIDEVVVRYLGHGRYKVAYLLTIRMKSGEEYKIVRNILKEPKTLAVDLAVMESPIGFSAVMDEIYRLIVGGGVFELFGEYGDHDGMLYWDEEYKKGPTLFDIRDAIDPGYIARRPGETIDAWRSRVCEAIREYVKVSFRALEVARRPHRALDVNAWNFIKVEDGLRLIDAGLDPEAQEDETRFWLLLRRNIAEMLQAYPDLQSAVTTADIHDGVLDALGERDGKIILRRIRGHLEHWGPQEDRWMRDEGSPYIRTFIKDRGRQELASYLRAEQYGYVPLKAQLPLTSQEESEYERGGRLFGVRYFLGHGFHRLRQSPWLWAYTQRRWVSPSLENAPLLEAMDKLIGKIRLKPAFASSSNKAQQSEWVAQTASKLGLNKEQAEYLRESVGIHAFFLYNLSAFLRGVLLTRGRGPEEYQTEILQLVEIVQAVHTDPIDAASRLQAGMKNVDLTSFLDALGNEKQSSEVTTEFRLVEATRVWERIVSDLIDYHYIDRRSFLEVLHKLPLDVLLMFLESGRYSDLMRDLMLMDHRRVAEVYKRLIPQDKDRAAELAAFSLEEKSMGYQGIAYFLTGLGTYAQVEWLNAATLREKVEGKFHAEWIRTRAEPEDYLSRAARIIARYQLASPRGGGRFFAAVLKDLGKRFSKEQSFLGEEEWVDEKGRRIEDLFFVLDHVPDRVWDEAFRFMTRAQIARALTAYLEIILAMETDRMEAMASRRAFLEFISKPNRFGRQTTINLLHHVFRIQDLPGEVLDTVLESTPDAALAEALQTATPSVLNRLMDRVYEYGPIARSRIVDVLEANESLRFYLPREARLREILLSDDFDRAVTEVVEECRLHGQQDLIPSLAVQELMRLQRLNVTSSIHDRKSRIAMRQRFLALLMLDVNREMPLFDGVRIPRKALNGWPRGLLLAQFYRAGVLTESSLQADTRLPAMMLEKLERFRQTVRAQDEDAEGLIGSMGQPRDFRSRLFWSDFDLLAEEFFALTTESFAQWSQSWSQWVSMEFQDLMGGLWSYPADRPLQRDAHALDHGDLLDHLERTSILRMFMLDLDLGILMDRMKIFPSSTLAVLESGTPHPIQASAMGPRVPVLEFAVRSGVAIGRNYPWANRIAEVEGEIRARLNIDPSLEIRYRICAGMGPLGRNTEDNVIEVSEEVLGLDAEYPGLLKRVMTYEWRHWLIAKERLFGPIEQGIYGPVPKGFANPMSEVFALLGEVCDARESGSLEEVTRQYAKLEPRIQGRQPLTELLRSVKTIAGKNLENPVPNDILIEKIVAFLEEYRTGLYRDSGFSEEDVDYLRSPVGGGAWLLDNEFVSATFARLSMRADISYPAVKEPVPSDRQTVEFAL